MTDYDQIKENILNFFNYIDKLKTEHMELTEQLKSIKVVPPTDVGNKVYNLVTTLYQIVPKYTNNTQESCNICSGVGYILDSVDNYSNYKPCKCFNDGVVYEVTSFPVVENNDYLYRILKDQEVVDVYNSSIKHSYDNTFINCLDSIYYTCENECLKHLQHLKEMKTVV